MGCFANRRIDCTVLVEKQCEKCSFFKTSRELEQQRRESRRRISALPPRKRDTIAAKYNIRVDADGR